MGADGFGGNHLGRPGPTVGVEGISNAALRIEG